MSPVVGTSVAVLRKDTADLISVVDGCVMGWTSGVQTSSVVGETGVLRPYVMDGSSGVFWRMSAGVFRGQTW